MYIFTGTKLLYVKKLVGILKKNKIVPGEDTPFPYGRGQGETVRRVSTLTNSILIPTFR